MKKPSYRIILASQSPQRRDMLATTGYDFEVMPAHIDEAAVTAASQKERARLVAEAKAQAVADLLLQKKARHFVVLAGDTYVVDPSTDQAFEKPADIDEAREMLASLSSKTVVEYTGVCFLKVDSNQKVTRDSTTISTECTFRELTSTEIDHYVTTEPVTTWSAAFCPAYPTGAALIAKVSGSLTSFTHGFPLEWFKARLDA